MSRWFRFYTSVLDDPKTQMLPPDLFKHWVNVLCIAAQHDGELPQIGVTAFLLGRVAEPKAAEVLSKLAAAGLLDRTEKSFRPHNWDARQYRHDKTDNTNAERQKRYRNGKRNADSNASSNGVTDVTEPLQQNGPDSTECSEAESNSEAIASGAEAPDPRTRLFREGLATVGRLTGKGPDACRSFVGKCLKEAGDDAVVVLGLIEDAERNRVVDPSAWIARCLKGRKANGNGPTGEISAAGSSLIERLNAGFGGTSPQEYSGSGASEADARLLSYGRS